MKTLLNFDDPPSKEEIKERAEKLAQIAKEEGAKKVMIGAALWLISSLERELQKAGITPVYSFSKRFCIEKVLPDGRVEKATTFRHEDFVEPPLN